MLVWTMLLQCQSSDCIKVEINVKKVSHNSLIDFLRFLIGRDDDFFFFLISDITEFSALFSGCYTAYEIQYLYHV